MYFYGLWGRQTQGPPRAPHTLATPLSEPFPITNVVKQGCVLALTLFSMMLRQATENLDDHEAVYIRYRLDGTLFNLRRLQAHTKTFEQLILDLLFADDAGLVAHSEVPCSA